MKDFDPTMMDIMHDLWSELGRSLFLLLYEDLSRHWHCIHIDVPGLTDTSLRMAMLEYFFSHRRQASIFLPPE